MSRIPIDASSGGPEPKSLPSGRVTPMMRQYLEMKQSHPDCILFFRLGDFYEMFFDDAVLASEILEITLTSREKGENGVPMCGVPHHSARSHIARLVERGHKVAVCEQTEEPGAGKKLVRREVVQVVTPGLVTDTEMLAAKESRYLLASVTGRQGFGFAYLDVTTGEFRVGRAASEREFADEVGRIAPHEVLTDQEGAGAPAWVPDGVRVTRVAAETARYERSRQRLAAHFGVADLGGYGLDGEREGVAAAGMVLAYLDVHHKAGLANVRAIARHLSGRSLFLGETTKRNLELFQTLAGGQREGALIGLLDRTRTAMGGRELRRRLAYPLLDVAGIEKRLDAVSELVARGDLRRTVREVLRSVGDVERLAGKVAMGSANARDLVALRASLAALPGLNGVIGTAGAERLAEVAGRLDALPELHRLLDDALADDPPALLTEGGLIREGFDAELDELRAVQRGGRGWIAELQARERERTGIASLRVGFNRVFGYYIEVSRARLDKVPDGYERRQTLANAERYITPELKEMEEKVLGAEERANALENRRFLEVRAETALHLDRLRRTASALAEADVLAALAELAVERRYVRPRVHDGYEFEIVGGRHPVVEALADSGRFVPNDVRFDSESNRLLIITGPNMSGKSTILRQTALISLLAQMGSFVPAESARLGVVDRVFTRVGASDDLARGRSTFLVEMMETAAILHNATDRSLVILDEIGRGTSTFDGLSIAWAVAEHIHSMGARTLFATHYHELTDLARTMRGVANFNVAVKQWQGKIIFLRRLVEGGVNRSYGIEVGELAGLPRQVVERAKEVLRNLETGELDETGLPKIAASRLVTPQIPHQQLDLFLGGNETKRARLVAEIAALTPDEMTPLEALVSLCALREEALGLLGDKGNT